MEHPVIAICWHQLAIPWQGMGDMIHSLWQLNKDGVTQYSGCLQYYPERGETSQLSSDIKTTDNMMPENK